MDLATVDRFMAELGIPRNPATLAAVIRFVQRAEGRNECFGTLRSSCDQWHCAFRSECVDKPVATELPPRFEGMQARWPAPDERSERPDVAAGVPMPDPAMHC